MSAVDRESYDELYRSTPAVWSGRPNRAAGRRGGRPAARHRAGRRKRRGRRRSLARRAGLAGHRCGLLGRRPGARAPRSPAPEGSTDRIEWRHEDLDGWTPPAGRFDLVTAHYLHATWSDRPAMFRRLATAVAPGGTLLVVGHLLGEHWGHGQHHAHDPGVLYTAEDVASLLDPEEWLDVVTETRERDHQAAERTGNRVPDTVLRARRRLPDGQAPSRHRERSGQERGRPRSARAAVTASSCSRSSTSSRCTSTPRRVSRRSAIRSRGSDRAAGPGAEPAGRAGRRAAGRRRPPGRPRPSRRAARPPAAPSAAARDRGGRPRPAAPAAASSATRRAAAPRPTSSASMSGETAASARR